MVLHNTSLLSRHPVLSHKTPSSGPGLQHKLTSKTSLRASYHLDLFPASSESVHEIQTRRRRRKSENNTKWEESKDKEREREV